LELSHIWWSNQMFWLKLNQIICISNCMLFFFFFDFWYDSIWRFWKPKIKKRDSKRWKIHKKWSRMILPVVFNIQVEPLLKIDQFHNCNNFSGLLRRFSNE
jgi:hypothetical protein